MISIYPLLVFYINEPNPLHMDHHINNIQMTLSYVSHSFLFISNDSAHFIFFDTGQPLLDRCVLVCYVESFNITYIFIKRYMYTFMYIDDVSLPRSYQNKNEFDTLEVRNINMLFSSPDIVTYNFFKVYLIENISLNDKFMISYFSKETSDIRNHIITLICENQSEE